jgi:hypothetical protein
MPIGARIAAMTDAQSYAGIVLLVGGDLNAQARVLDAARRAGGTLQRVSSEDLAVEIASKAPSMVVIDLDEVGARALAAVPPDSGSESPMIVAYFSHVDAALGESARQAGVQALPRGRFWRELPSLVESAFAMGRG